MMSLKKALIIFAIVEFVGLCFVTVFMLKG